MVSLLNEKLILLAMFFITLVAISSVSAFENGTDEVVAIENDINGLQVYEDDALEIDDNAELITGK